MVMHPLSEEPISTCKLDLMDLWSCSDVMDLPLNLSSCRYWGPDASALCSLLAATDDSSAEHVTIASSAAAANCQHCAWLCQRERCIVSMSVKQSGHSKLFTLSCIAKGARHASSKAFLASQKSVLHLARSP